MIADISDHGAGHEALLEAIAQQAARAPRRQLTILLGLAILGAVATAFTVRYRLPIAIGIGAGCTAVALLVLRELVHRSPRGTTRLRASLQKGLAALGVLLWFLSGMAFLVALLGTPWML